MTIERTDLAAADHDARVAEASATPRVVTVVISADTSAFERAMERLADSACRAGVPIDLTPMPAEDAP